ncbi:MAG TPA: Holliday junction branch migration protein RuvA [Firmicutes bacterium]|nr:Holliday junction branch migration protein RuvA [Bacillota bacterium]
MISYLKGTLAWRGEDRVIVETGGVGYQVFVSPVTLSALPQTESEVQLFTHMSVKEDGISLFGFRSMEELTLFHQLIGVSGVGPKGALALLGVLPASQIRIAIVTEDAAALAKAPGLGKKTAQKIIIDLKDKMKNETLLPEGWEETPQEMTGAGPKTEALEALLALGYSRSEAVRALANLPQEDTESLLKAALKRMLQ